MGETNRDRAIDMAARLAVPGDDVMDLTDLIECVLESADQYSAAHAALDRIGADRRDTGGNAMTVAARIDSLGEDMRDYRNAAGAEASEVDRRGATIAELRAELADAREALRAMVAGVERLRTGLGDLLPNETDDKAWCATQGAIDDIDDALGDALAKSAALLERTNR